MNFTTQDFHIDVFIPNAIAPVLTEQDVFDAIQAKLLEKLDMTMAQAKKSAYSGTTIAVTP